MLDPPPHVLLVAERADHDNTCAECGIHLLVSDHRNVIIEERNADCASNKACKPLVIGMHGNRNACRQQLGSGGRNLQILATVTIVTAIHYTEVEIVEMCLAILILDLSKCDRCSASRAPVHRSLALVDPPVSIHPHKRLLGHAVIRRIHRHVLAVPVNGESEPVHRILHFPYVF